MIFPKFWKHIKPMDPHLITAHSKIHAGTDGIVTAAHLENQDRPVGEVLSVLDKAIISLHDAKAAVVSYRNQVYHKHFVDAVEQPHDPTRNDADESPVRAPDELPQPPAGGGVRALPEAGSDRPGDAEAPRHEEEGPWSKRAGGLPAGQPHGSDHPVSP